MPGRLVSILLLLVAGPAAARDLTAGVAACRSHADDIARLSCYDALPVGGDVVEYSGAGSAFTPEFAITRPTRLSFESRDAVMVMYLLDAQGNVVQNLHKGGAGGDSYMIETPGTYRVQVNATGGWRIEMEKP